MEFTKVSLAPYISKYNFSDIDQVAANRVGMVVEVLVYNLLSNVMYVMKALKVKTIQKKHFDGVVQIMKGCLGGVMAGGSPLPSEYFGSSSGRYFDQAEYHNTSYVDDMTRAPMWFAEAGSAKAGSSALISISLIKSIIEKYRREHPSYPFKVSKEAEAIMCESVLSNLNKLLEECAKGKGKANKLTVALLNKTLEKNFSHMSYVWKGIRTPK